MNELKLFKNEQFGEIRWIKIDEKDYAVGIDIAKALGYKDPNSAISRHCKGSVKHRIADNTGFAQQMNIIPEGDIYRLIVKSKLPGAEKFESWIFDEVLPSIRKQGFYGRPTMELIQEMISELPEGSKRLIATSLSNSLLPMKKSTDVLYDFLDTKTSFIMLDPNKFPVVDYKIFTDYMITNGYNPDKIIRDLILEDMIKLSEFMQPIITQLINGKYISTIIFKIEASNKLYEE